MHLFDSSTHLITRISGPVEAPAVIYIPGIHGDWTPLWRIRELLNSHCRLIEIAYPRTATRWTLDDYVERLRDLFDKLELMGGHLLAESFGSLVGWSFCCRYPGRVKTLMVAGGFCSTPGRLKVALADMALHLAPAALLDRFVDLYLCYLKRRGFPRDAFRRPNEFFPATRTRQGWRSTHNRLKIISRTDVRTRLCELRVPILYFGGARDWVVPVRREIAALKRHLSPDCGFQHVLFPRAPHPIIPARYPQVARLITDWVARHEGKIGAPQQAED
jgi:pimeloyl-ACP methyl ester carboxylesterase